MIRGRQKEDEVPRVFLHRGIAARQFQRSFVLAEGIEVLSAKLEEGLLSIDLAKPPAERAVQEDRHQSARPVKGASRKE